MCEFGTTFSWYRDGNKFAEGKYLSVMYLYDLGHYKCTVTTTSGVQEDSEEVEVIAEHEENRESLTSIISDGRHTHCVQNKRCDTQYLISKINARGVK